MLQEPKWMLVNRKVFNIKNYILQTNKKNLQRLYFFLYLHIN